MSKKVIELLEPPYNTKDLENYVKNKYKIIDDQWRALHSITYDFHDETILDNKKPYKLSNDEYDEVIKIADEFRNIIVEKYNTNTKNVKKLLQKQIRKPYKFYKNDRMIYFKDNKGTIYYSSDDDLEYFHISELSESDIEMDDINSSDLKLKIYNLNYIDSSIIYSLFENTESLFEFDKIPKESGHYISLFREIKKNQFEYTFDFIKFNNIDEIYKKDKKDEFTIQISINDIICWTGKIEPKE